MKLHLTRRSRARAKAQAQREQHHAQALQDRHAELQELRKAYRCPHCHGWHLTSQQKRRAA